MGRGRRSTRRNGIEVRGRNGIEVERERERERERGKEK